MFDLIFSFFKWLFSLWKKVPDSVKQKIIELIVKEFTEIFRNYYKRWQKDKDI